MMDPLNAVGLASNIAQLVQLGGKVVSQSKELYESGATAKHEDLKLICRDLEAITSRILPKSQKASAMAHGTKGDALLPQMGDLPSNGLAIELDQKRYRMNRSLPLKNEEAGGDELTSFHPEGVLIDRVSIDTVQQLSQRSNEITKSLGSLLESLSLGQGGTRKRKRDAFQQSLKAIWKHDEIEKLKKRLESLQEELNLRLTFNLRNHLYEIRSSITQLSLHDNRHEASERASKQLEYLQSQWKQADWVLRGLTYEAIDQQEKAIKDVHKDTFGWVFDEERTGFPAWARSSNSTFWITGKAGSGKTTLMKFVCEDPRCRELLRLWSGNNKLVVARHFFWIAGTEIQKSHEGLLRSLLFQVLHQCPELIPSVFPDRFKTRDEQPSWSMKELEHAITAVARQNVLSARFCFFIDGLDEYNGVHQDIIRALKTLASSSSVKLCLASRPWNPFVRAFGSDEACTFALHDHSRRDIYNFVTDLLRDSPLFQEIQYNESEAESLIRTIIDKAQGVFLWVVLVVRTLLEGLDEGDDMPMLHRRVAEFPESLDDYYRRMFENVQKIYKTQTARILLFAYHTCGRPFPMSVLTFLGEEIESPTYALNLPADCFWRPELSQQKRYLNARCRDLLEISNREVRFLHRTVLDFLDLQDIQTSLRDLAGPDFDVDTSSARAQLALSKATNPEATEINWDGVWDCETRVAGNAGLQSELFLDLKEFGKTLIWPDGGYEANPWDARNGTVDPAFLDLTNTNDMLLYVEENRRQFFGTSAQPTFNLERRYDRFYNYRLRRAALRPARFVLYRKPTSYRADSTEQISAVHSMIVRFDRTENQHPATLVRICMAIMTRLSNHYQFHWRRRYQHSYHVEDQYPWLL